jgi:hypothetical protein
MKKFGGVLIMLLLTIGCSSFEKSNGEADSLPSQVGAPGPEENISEPKKWTTEMINKETGYEPYTKRFFKGIYLSTSFHMVERGENVGTYESFPNQRIRVQLVERNQELDYINLVKEETYTNGEKLTVQLPEKTGVLYTYSQEALGENDEVLDTDVAVFYVPPKEFNARIYTGKEVYDASDTMKVHVENWGPTQLDFGKPYILEKRTFGTWKNVSGQQAFEDIGYRLEPQNTYTQEIDLEPFHLSSGQYRVVKEFEAVKAEITKQLAAKFEIQ